MVMEYVSTRDGSVRVSAAQAIVQGISKEGGLFVPVQIPKVSLEFIDNLRALPYAGRALRVLSPYLPEFSQDELSGILSSAYQGFDVPEVAPLVGTRDGVFMLELWHGPTLAFKDVALQLMPRLLTACAKKVGERRQILILVATSGDTGKAALEGFADVPGTAICVFYPEAGVSQAQRLQMVTQQGGNTHVIAVQGNFDDAQTGVKHIFADSAFAKALDERGIVLSSANSINLGRLLPQIVYYFSAYADLLERGEISLGDPIDVCVPTGNFGNILAAYYAKEMGLPIRRLVCASNANHVLSDFLSTGVYDRNRPFHLTTSPSMDILISSNLERLLHALCGAEAVVSMMDGLKNTGKYALPPEAAEKLRSLMHGGWADEAQVQAQIRQTFNSTGYLLDPHTAVAEHVLRAYQNQEQDPGPAVVASTASPYKFGRAVLTAIQENQAPEDEFACCERLSELSHWPLPGAIMELPKKPVLHARACAVPDMRRALTEELGL